MTATTEEVKQARVREKTWIEETFELNPMTVLQLNPDNVAEVLVRPGHNSRPIPAVGDKSILTLAANMGALGGNQLPCLATIDPETGAADIYDGAKRARAAQTWNRDNPDQAIMLNVLITETVMRPADVFERSLAMNVFREEMGPLEKTAAILHLMSDEGGGYNTVETAKRMNMAIGAVSAYARFDLLPENAKKALIAGKMTAGAAERFIALLPGKKAIRDDTEGTLLAAAQAKISRLVAAMLARDGKVGSGAVDSATRKVASGKDATKAANGRQRKTKQVIDEIDKYVGSLEDDTVIAAVVLKAFRGFLNGKSISVVVKAVEKGVGSAE